MSQRVQLFESAGSAPSRVDREKCVIYGVKVLGRFSPNRHGLKEVTDGTEYTREAMDGALPLYEGQKVNVDHPPRDKPNVDRSSLDRSGKLFNVRVEWGNADPSKDGIYGDLKLIPSHPMTPRLLDCASDPDLNDCFGLSHNAWGRGDVVNGRYVVTAIPEVRSVDVVADAGTVRSLFESREDQPVKKKLKQILESMKPEVRKKFVRVFENDEFSGVEAEDAGGDASAEDHLCNAITAIIKDGSMDLGAKKKKIGKLLGLMQEEGEGKGTSTEESEEEGDGDEGKDKGKKVEESKKAKKLEAENKALRVCMESGITKPADSLIKAMVSLTESEMKELAQGYKPAGTGTGGQTPRTQPPGAAGGQTTPVQEGRQAPKVPTDAKSTAAWLRN